MNAIFIKIKKIIEQENIPVFIMYSLLFLLPIFVLPLAIWPVAFSKAILFYIGVTVAFLFWLFAVLQKGNLLIPKSILFVLLGVIIVVWLIASIFSLNFKLSFIGAGYEIGTFIFFLFMGIGLFLISSLFQTEKRAFLFYFFLFISSFIVFVFQLLHTIFHITIIPWQNIFQGPVSNLAGGWNDFAIFFGFFALTSLCFFELYKFSNSLKGIFIIAIFLSLIAMLAVNLSISWFILGFFVLFLILYLFFDKKNIYSFKFSLFILSLIIFLFLMSNQINNLTSFIKTDIIFINPSWSVTSDIIRGSLKHNFLLGSGPNTFSYNWLKFKPLEINNTVFWNTPFQTGAGYLPSMISDTGIIGGLAILAFLLALIFYGFKIIFYIKNDLTRTLLVSSFLGSLYFWAFTVFYSPGFLIFVLAFFTTGLFLAMLVKADKIKVFNISFIKNSLTGFVSVIIIILLLIGSFISIYFFSKKYLSVYLYSQGVKILNTENNIEKGEAKILKATQFDKQDVYFRTLAEIGIIKTNKIINQQNNLPLESLREQFQNSLVSSIKNAQDAIKINPFDPLNRTQLGKIYESIVPFNIAGANEFAINSYNEALKISPFDPSFFVSMARVEIQLKNFQKAREYLNSSLALKKDFAPALFVFSQLEAQDGNLDKAIQRAKETVILVPNDIGALYQLGFLNYQNKNYSEAALSLERAVALSPQYSNARYFLGFSYDKLGRKEEAINQFLEIEKFNPDNDEVKRILNNLRTNKEILLESEK